MSVSYSATSASTIQGGFYLEQQIKVEKVKVPKMTHLFPVLQDLEIPGKEGTNPTVQSYIEDAEDGKGVTIQRLPVVYRNQDPEQLQRQLDVIKSHYAVQVLFIAERTRRRGITTEEMTARTSIITKLEFSIPLKEKLVALWSCKLAEKFMIDMKDENEANGAVSSVVEVSTTTADTDTTPMQIPRENEESNLMASTDFSSQLRIQNTMRERFNDTVSNFENTINSVLGRTMRPEEKRKKK